MKVFAAVACFVMLASCTWAARYTVVDLGALPGWGESRATDINNSGVVVGAITDSSGHEHAFLYNKQMYDLGSLEGYPHSAATSINDRGDVVGYCRPASSSEDYHAFLWKSGKMTDLGAIPGYTHWTIPEAINNSGQIVGSSYTSSFSGHAFLYNRGTISDLNSLISQFAFGTPAEVVTATAINNSGHVVGSMGSDTRAFLWQDGIVTNLGTLPGGNYSHAFSINDSGQVAGQASVNGGIKHGFLYDGQMMDLGALPDYPESLAYGINNSGAVVGRSYKDFQNKRAFLYERGELYDLNTLIDPGSGWTLLEAHAINNSGQIVGHCKNAQNQQHAFLLIPVSGGSRR